MVKDMTEGSPTRLLLGFGWPLFLGNLTQMLYSVCDRLIAARFIGANALAAIAPTTPVFFMVLGFMFGTTCGVSVITSQRFGAKDPRGVRLSVATGAWVVVTMAVIMTALCLILTEPILRLMNTPGEVFADSLAYMKATFWGNFCLFFFSFQTATLRAFGNSITPLILMVSSGVLNILFDLLFMGVFGWGLASAAWATNVAVFLCALWCFLFVIRKMPQLQMCRGDWRIRWRIARSQLAVGIPMGLQFSVTGLGTTILQRSINTFGVLVMTGLTAAEQFCMLVVQVPVALGQSLATYSAQNFGAGRMGRIRGGVRAATKIVLAVCLTMTAIGLLFGRELTAIFVPEGTEGGEAILDYGETLLLYTSPFYVPLGLIFVFRNTLQGIGHSILAMIAGGAEMVARVTIAVFCIPMLGVAAIYWADPGAWIGACLVLIPSYLIVMHRLYGRDRAPEAYR